MLNVKPDPHMQNSIFQHTVENHVDEKQVITRGFIVYGYQNTILSRGDDLIKNLLEFQPLLKEIKNDSEMSMLNPTSLTDEQHDAVLEEARRWLQEEGFEVGPLETKTKLEWVTEAGWADGFQWHHSDDDCDVEDAEQP